jgi:CIC family chloride channel protein
VPTLPVLTSGRAKLGLLVSAIRESFRTRDDAFLLLALLVGLLAGALTLLQGALAHALQAWWYGLGNPDMRLSSLPEIAPMKLLALPLFGIPIGLISLAARARRRQLVDAVEANALHGGRMSMRDNLIVATQTILSNGSGASVGLEAAYAQMGAGAGSQLGRILRLRRADIRTLVGTGAAAAIATAFSAPLTGAFYGFEVIIGAYSPSALAPVAVAVLGASTLRAASGVSFDMLQAPLSTGLEFSDYVLYVLLGLVCALVGVGVMRLVPLIEQGVERIHLPSWSRPAVGGLLLIPLAMVTPQVLSSGHGALHIDMTLHEPLRWLALLLFMKCLASAISLGFGFRGGLFFASLFVGTLVGTLFSGLLGLAFGGQSPVDPTTAALVGMAALAASVIGAPMTMAMLVLEGTHDFAVTSAAIAAILVSSTVTRQIFGYSFSTWRLHLRGAEIRSARDVGWVRNLNAGTMMRRAPETYAASMSVAGMRERLPLGAATRAVLVDGEGCYAGIVVVADIYADLVKLQARVADYARNKEVALSAEDDALVVMRKFDASQSDELAVVDAQRHVLGVLSERFVRKRYAEELDRRQRELLGERIGDAD